MAWDSARINEAPQYELTCGCGITIRGNSENGIVSLVKQHIESGKFHTAWMLVNKYSDTPSTFEIIIKEASAMKKKLGVTV